MPDTLPSAFALVAGCLLAACPSAATAQAAPRPWSCSSGAFRSCFIQTDSLVLEQTERHVLAALSGLARDERGNFIASDYSEADIKVFDRRGRLLRVIGRKGRGPGEFQRPARPLVSRGALHVLDTELQRVSIFDSGTGHPRTIQVQQAGYLTSLGTTTEGLVVGGVTEAGAALMTIDALGRPARRLLDSDRLRRAGSDPGGFWRMMTEISFATDRERAFVVSTVQDSLWTVDLRTGATRVEVIPAAATAPKPPPPDRHSPSAIMAWARSLLTPQAVFHSEGEIAVVLVRGSLFRGDPSTLAIRKVSGDWITLTGAPAVLEWADGILVGLLSTDPDRVTLGLFRRR